MWKLNTGGDPEDEWLSTTNHHIGRQHWEFDPGAGTPSEHALIQTLREEFKKNRFNIRQSSDLLVRLQLRKENPCTPIPPAVKVKETEPMHSKSSAAISMAENPSDHVRTKHMKVKYHYVRELIEERGIKMAFCRSNFQLADLFTKALPKWRFESLRKMVGVLAAQNKGGAVDLCCLMQPAMLKIVEEITSSMKVKRKSKVKNKIPAMKRKLEMMVLRAIQRCLDSKTKVRMIGSDEQSQISKKVEVICDEN